MSTCVTVAEVDILPVACKRSRCYWDEQEDMRLMRTTDLKFVEVSYPPLDQVTEHHLLGQGQCLILDNIARHRGIPDIDRVKPIADASSELP